MTTARHAITVVLLLAGGGCALLGAVGALAMRCTLDRLHYLAVASGPAALLVGLALAVDRPGLDAVKVLLTVGLLVATGPVVSAATARAAHDAAAREEAG